MFYHEFNHLSGVQLLHSLDKEEVFDGCEFTFLCPLRHVLIDTSDEFPSCRAFEEEMFRIFCIIASKGAALWDIIFPAVDHIVGFDVSFHDLKLRDVDLVVETNLVNHSVLCVPKLSV